MPPSSFVRQDARLLKDAFDVSLFAYSGLRSLSALRRAVGDADAVVLWFVGRHSPAATWLARRRGVPVVSIVGGYEVAWVETIGYGLRPGSARDRVVRWVLNASTAILAVSDFSLGEIRSRHPEIVGRVRRVYNAVDTARFDIDPSSERAGVLSVGVVNRETLGRKAWPLYWEIARLMPNVHFVAVGAAPDEAGRRFVSQRPQNLIWRGTLSHEELSREYHTARVYFQGSLHEAFCVSMAEAMACGCVPAVARRGALPEVAGDAAYYFDEHSPEAAAAAVVAALRAPDTLRAAVRQRVIDRFNAKRRREELCTVVCEVLQARDAAPGAHGGAA